MNAPRLPDGNDQPSGLTSNYLTLRKELPKNRHGQGVITILPTQRAGAFRREASRLKRGRDAGALQLVQPGIGPIAGNQRVMRALFDHPALVHHHDQIGVADG